MVIAVAAVFVSTSTAPEPPLDPGFSTPTLTPTATATTDPSPTLSPLIGTQVGNSSTNCTFTFEAWRAYPDAWGLASIRIGTTAYSTADVLAIFNGDSADPQTRMLQQLFAVVINQRNGADPNTIITTLSSAHDWLVNHPVGSALSEEDRQAALLYAQQLEDYNTGSMGPGACPFSIQTPTPTITSTPVNTPTATITNTPLVPPSATPRPVVTSAFPINPTPTPFPTRERPDRTEPPPPTQPPPPTSPPPTEPPPPTPTSAPVP